MEKQRMKFYSVGLLNSLKEEQGFIFANLMILLPIIFSLLIFILVIVNAIMNNILGYVDNWMLTQQTKSILENIATEITYADEVSEYTDFANKKTLVVATKRRATANSTLEENYLGYRKEGAIIYRCEMYKLNDGSYTIKSKQPLNSENYFGNDNIEFNWNKLEDNLYAIEVKGSSYTTSQQFSLQTIVIQRNSSIKVR